MLRHILPAFAFAAVMFGVLAVVVSVATRHEDALIKAHSEQVLHGVLLTYEDELAKLGRDYAYWNEAMDNLLVALDARWADQNVGAYLVESFGLSASLVIDGQGRVIFARARSGERVPTLGDFRPPLGELLARARQDAQGAPLPVTGYGLQGGKPHLIAAVRLTPHSEPARYRGVSGFLVISRALDRPLLDKLQSHFGFVGLHLVPGNAGRFELSDFQGAPFYGLDWHDSASATRLASTLGRWLSGATALILLALFLAYWRVLRLAQGYQALSRSLESRVRERTRELELATARAQQASLAKTRFLSSMSHELRTPLNAVLGFAQLIRIESADDPAGRLRGHVEEILAAGRHLLALVEEVLDLSGIESGGMQLEIEQVDTRRLLDGCLRLAAPLMGRHGVSLEDLSGESLPAIRVDERRAEQAVLNLLSNAAKYNRPGGRAWIDAGPGAAGMLRISVGDNGLGIPEAQHPLVFQAFNRLGRENLEIEGTGIGLALTQRIVEAMGGAVGFESQLGQGSRFWLDLPLAPGRSSPQSGPSPLG